MKWVQKILNRQNVSGAHESIAVRLWNIIALIFTMLTAALIIAIVMVTLNTRKENSVRESETIINGITSTLRGNIDNYKDLSRLVMINETIMEFLRAENVDSGLKNDSIYAINDILIVCNNVDSFFIFRNDGDYVSTGRGEYFIDREMMNRPEWLDQINEKRGGAIIRMNGNGAIFRRNGNQFITVARTVYDIYSQKKTGILLMNISMHLLETAIGENENAGICIVSENGDYLAGDEELAGFFTEEFRSGEMIHKDNGDKRFHMISGYKPDELPIVIMCRVTPAGTSVPAAVLVVLTLLAVVFAISIVLLASYISKDINRPILDLSEAMEDTKKSGWLKKIEVRMPDNEIGQLAVSYNSMNEYLNEILTRLIEQEKTVRGVEMRVLQEQIKPHFLYNSLETISYMAYEAGATKAFEALETLGNFYRNFLSKGNREIPLKREIQIIKDYLSIQKLRYGDILSDEYDVDEAANELMIPKLILQPLVENSIYHGIRPKGEPGVIKISANLDGDILNVIVYDSGIGMSEEQIGLILEEKDDDEDENPALSGFGLKGTIKRIRYFCKDKNAIEIFSEEGEYTKIVLRINTKQQGE
ncbi:MAG: histidine kinase [Lachnospiraceae bacterium]|nr:histidine kinase [Lachnospiraceae bacterium]